MPSAALFDETPTASELATLFTPPASAAEPPAAAGTNPQIQQSTNPGSDESTNPVSDDGTSRNTEHETRIATTDHSPLTTDPSPIEIQNSKIKNPAEHCLECHALLPPLRPDGGRPSYFCPECFAPLPPGGDCRMPSIEQCPEPDCHANLPRVRPNGERPTDRCLRCGNTLPPPPISTDQAAAA